MRDDLSFLALERWLNATGDARAERLNDLIEALRAKALRQLPGDFLDVLLLIEARWRTALEQARGELVVYMAASREELEARFRLIVAEGFEGGVSDLYS